MFVFCFPYFSVHSIASSHQLICFPSRCPCPKAFSRRSHFGVHCTGAPCRPSLLRFFAFELDALVFCQSVSRDNANRFLFHDPEISGLIAIVYSVYIYTVKCVFIVIDPILYHIIYYTSAILRFVQSVCVPMSDRSISGSKHLCGSVDPILT